MASRDFLEPAEPNHKLREIERDLERLLKEIAAEIIESMTKTARQREPQEQSKRWWPAGATVEPERPRDETAEIWSYTS